MRAASSTLLVATGLLRVARPGGGRSPSFPQPVFSYRTHPDLPLQAFAAGRLGIVGQGWDASYLIVAYRHIAGVGLDRAERRALLALWERRAGPVAVGKAPPMPSSTALDAWLEARQAAGAPAILVSQDRLIGSG